MAFSSENGNSPIRYYSLVTGVIVTSIILALGVAYQSFVYTMWDKPLGYMTNELKYCELSVKNGEAWFAAIRYYGNPFWPTFSQRVMRLNLESGEAHETGIVFKNEWFSSRWIGDDFYVFTRK